MQKSPPYAAPVYHVAVLFEEPEINCLISELISARGIKTRIITDTTDVQENEKLATEPQFLRGLNPDKKATCLVIGNKESLLGLPGIKLTRPLTENKIQQALEEFLSL